MTIDNVVQELDSSALSLVSILAQELRDKQSLLSSAETEVATLKGEIDKLTAKRLPDAMTDLGLAELRLVTGEKLTVKPEYHCGIPAARKEEAFQELRDRGLGDVIKTQVALEFGRGQEEEALALFKKLAAEHPNIPSTIGQGVHAQTLKALVKEQFESGNPLPEDLFGVFIINRATLKAPKGNDANV